MGPDQFKSGYLARVNVDYQPRAARTDGRSRIEYPLRARNSGELEMAGYFGFRMVGAGGRKMWEQGVGIFRYVCLLQTTRYHMFRTFI